MGIATRQLKKWRNKTEADAAFKEALWCELDAAFIRMYPSSVRSWRRMILYPAATMALVVTMGAGTYVYASSSVTNQSALYPVKRTLESIESHFYAAPAGAATFHMRMMDRRLQEGEALLQASIVDEASLSEIGEEMDLFVVQVAEINDAQERRQELFLRLQAGGERYEYLLYRANEARQKKLLDHDTRLRNTIEQLRVRVDASGLSEEEKHTLLLRLHTNLDARALINE
jgi:hypothetical protein